MKWKLPDGSITEDYEEYYSAYEPYIKMFEKKGFVVIGFDPGFSITTKESHQSANIPFQFARMLLGDG